MILKQMALGPIQANCYILGCEKTKEAVVIDSGDEPDKILMALSNEKLSLKYVISTHGHFDHVGANHRLKKVTNAKIVMHTFDSDLLKESEVKSLELGINFYDKFSPDIYVNDGDVINFGNYSLKVLHTPGHTKGSISLYTKYIDLKTEVEKVFVGDTLFANSIGRTDLPGGDFETLIISIKKKLFILNDDVTVYPGHMNLTKIGIEKKTNPFCGINV